MQREEALTITSLPPELLAAIFGQLVPCTSTTEDVECDDHAGSGLDLLENGYTCKGKRWDVMGEDSACTEDEEEDEGADRGNESKKNSRLAPSVASRPSMEAVEAVLMASAVCSGWREVLIKENGLWKRVRSMTLPSGASIDESSFSLNFSPFFGDGKVRADTFRTRAADLDTMARVARPHVANT